MLLQVLTLSPRLLPQTLFLQALGLDPIRSLTLGGSLTLIGEPLAPFCVSGLGSPALTTDFWFLGPWPCVARILSLYLGPWPLDAASVASSIPRFSPLGF